MEQNTSIIQRLLNILTADRRITILLVVSIVLVIIFIIVAVVFFSKSSSNEVTSSLPPEVGSINGPVQKIEKKTIPATLSLVLKGKKTTFKVNDSISFTVVGDSGGQTILGYDAVFKFDKNIVSYMNSKNLDSKFDYQQRTRGNWIMISGVQKFADRSEIILKEKKLLEIQFKAIKPGIAYFPLSYVEGRLSDSNLINELSEDILTKVAGVTVRITQ